MFIDWSFWKWLDFMAFISFLVIPVPMMIVTWLYVNKTPRKQRLIELGYGTDNAWYRGKWIGFVDANYLFAMLPTVAYAMRFRKDFLGKKIPEMTLTPNLEFNDNYNKLLNEFKFFVRWVITMVLFIAFGMTVLGIGMGIDKGWFSF